MLPYQPHLTSTIQLRSRQSCQVYLGTLGVDWMDEFSEKLQTAFDPPPLVSESVVALFPEMHD